MYRSCLFCTRSLGTNERIEHFPVGSRLAFDAKKGRLWVVCSSCARWNLTPFEERWEAIEECERLYRGTTARVSTPNIGMARFDGRFDLIRIGKPLRPEFAAWRYGQQFAARFRQRAIIASTGTAAAAVAGVTLGLTAPGVMSAGAISIIAIPGLTTILGAIPVIGVLAARDYLMYDRVVGRFTQGKRLITVRAKHLDDIELETYRDGELKMVIPHDRGWVEMQNGAAMHAAGVLLSGANRYGAAADQVQHAVTQIERAGDARRFLAAATERNGWRRGRVVSVLKAYRGLGAMQLSSIESLALEMSVHEEAERRAMDGELADLEQAWRNAEEIAAICDDDLSPPKLYE